MSTSVARPNPPIPSHIDLRSHDWFPLYHERLLRSRWFMGASDLARSRNLELWCESWKQVPASSLPDDDVQLAHWAGYGRNVPEFRREKAELMEPWMLCNDDRWYHPTLAEIALDQWNRKSDADRKKAEERERKRIKREGGGGSARRTEATCPAENSNCPPDNAAIPPDNGPLPPDHGGLPADAPRTEATCPAENALKGNQRKTEERKGAYAPIACASDLVLFDDARPGKLTKAGIDQAFEQFWEGYPRKTAKQDARKAFEKVIRAGLRTVDQLIRDVAMYAASRDVARGVVMHAATFLNGQRWTDEHLPEVQQSRSQARGGWSPLDYAAETLE